VMVATHEGVHGSGARCRKKPNNELN
jgi:hypothetical protein